jgi:hypothetical protein
VWACNVLSKASKFQAAPTVSTAKFKGRDVRSQAHISTGRKENAAFYWWQQYEHYISKFLRSGDQGSQIRRILIKFNEM